MTGEELFKLGEQSENEGNGRQAYEYYCKAADAANVPAMIKLAGFFENNQDYSRAAFWWWEAADGGDAYAMNAFGTMCLTGKGIKKDVEKGLKYLMQSAECGEIIAMFNLGQYYSMQKNDSEAFKWHLKAAEAGAPFAMSEVATMYLTGAGVEKNETEGLKWLQKSAELGDPPAMAMFARMYELGIIVEQDIHEALKWYTEAANAGEEHAQERLKTLFEEGN